MIVCSYYSYCRKIDSEMLNKSKNSKAFQGIRCQGDFVPLEHDLWGDINFP